MADEPSLLQMIDSTLPAGRVGVAWQEGEDQSEGARMGRFLAHASRNGLNWDQTRSAMQSTFAGVDPDQMRPVYDRAEQHRRLGNERYRLQNTGENWVHNVLHAGALFSGAVHDYLDSRNYARAQERFNQGRPEEGDYRIIAERERLQQIAAQRSTGEQIAHGLLSVPTLVGETMLGGAALRGGLALTGIGRTAVQTVAASASRTATQAAGRLAQAAPGTAGHMAATLEAQLTAGLAGRAAQVAGHEMAARVATQQAYGRGFLGTLGAHAAATVVTPSMVLPAMGERQAQRVREGGSSILSFGQDVAPAFTMAMMQNAIFGSLGQVGSSITGATVRAAAHRLLTRTGTGMAAQQGVDFAASAISEVLPKAYKLETGYGILGSALQGHWGEVWQRLAVQATTFAAFSSVHGLGADPTRHITEAARGLRREGMARNEAGEMLKNIQDVIMAAPDKVQAAQLAGGYTGAARRYADILADGRPEPAKQPPPPAQPPAGQTGVNQVVTSLPTPGLPQGPPPPPRNHSEPPAGLSIRAREAWKQRYAETSFLKDPFDRSASADAHAAQVEKTPPPANAWASTGTKFGEDGSFKDKDGKVYHIEEVQKPVTKLATVAQGHEHIQFVVRDAEGRKIGSYDVHKNDGLVSGHVVLDSKEHQGKGIAEAMYDYAHSKHGVPVPSEALLKGGAKLWARNAEWKQFKSANPDASYADFISKRSRSSTGEVPVKSWSSAEAQPKLGHADLVSETAPKPPAEYMKSKPDKVSDHEYRLSWYHDNQEAVAKHVREQMEARLTGNEPVEDMLRVAGEVAGLNAREQRIIENRFSNDPKTHKELAAEFKDVGERRVGQMEAMARAKLGGIEPAAEAMAKQRAGIKQVIPKAESQAGPATTEEQRAVKRKKAKLKPSEQAEVIRDEVMNLVGDAVERNRMPPTLMNEVRDVFERNKPEELKALSQRLQGMGFRLPEHVLAHMAGQAQPGEPVTPAQAQATGESAKGPWDFIRTMDHVFQQAKAYIESVLPFGSRAKALADLKAMAEYISSNAQGDHLVRFEERMHSLAETLGFRDTKALHDPKVAAGFREFYEGVVGGTAPMNWRTMFEGLSEYLAKRLRGNVSGFSENQKAAAAFADKWIGDVGIKEGLDRLGEMQQAYEKASPVGQAAATINQTGQPGAPQMTGGERVKGWWQRTKDWLRNAWDTDLSILLHMGNDKAYNVWSDLRFKGKELAERWAKEGVSTIQNGHEVTIGMPMDKIMEPIKDLGQDGLTKADIVSKWLHIRHLESIGEKEIVGKQDRDVLERAFLDIQQDPNFQKYLAFAKNLTDANNSLLLALASPDIHAMSHETVKFFMDKYKFYADLHRVQTDDMKQWGSGGREHPAKVIHERHGSGGELVNGIVLYNQKLEQFARRMIEQRMDNAIFEFADQPGMGKYFVKLDKPPQLTALGRERYDAFHAMGMKEKEINNMLAGIPDVYESGQGKWPNDPSKATKFWYGPGGELLNFRIGDPHLYELLTMRELGSGDHVVKFFRAMGQWGFDAPWAPKFLAPEGRIEPFKIFTRGVKTGATNLNLAFNVRNQMRDAFDFAANTIDMASVKDLPWALQRAYAFESQVAMGNVPADMVFQHFVRHGGRGTKFYGREIKDIRNPMELAQAWLNTAGAGELGPRFLEWLNVAKKEGWSHERIEKALREAYDRVAQGGQFVDPIPAELLHKMNYGSREVTTDFSRLGYIARAINGVTPFFGPQIAGMSKAMRNWQVNPMGAGVMMGAFLGLKLLHFLTYKDEPWYQELQHHDRFANFVIPVAGSLYRIPGPRDLHVPVGAFTTSLLEHMADKNPDFRGAVLESLAAVSPPAPLPVPATMAWELGTNRNWMGSPIVPRAQENMPASHNFWNYQLPYALQQLSGGRAEFSIRGAGIVPFTQVRNATRSITDYFEQIHQLEAQRTLARRAGQRFEQEAQYNRLHSVESQMRQMVMDISGRVQGGRDRPKPSEERIANIRERMTRLAQRVLGVTP